MFILKLNSLGFIRNGELLGRANLSLISIVSENMDDAITSELVDNTDNIEAILEKHVAEGLNIRYFPNIQRITDHSVVTFGETGLTLYESTTVPETLHWSLIAIDTESDIHQLGTRLEKLFTSHAIEQSLSSSLFSLIAKTSIGSVIAQVVGNVIVRTLPPLLKIKKADKLGQVLSSFNRSVHYPENERKVSNAADITGNMTYSYELMETTLAERPEKTENPLPVTICLPEGTAGKFGRTLLQSSTASAQQEEVLAGSKG
jgi:hypothetical protein